MEWIHENPPHWDRAKAEVIGGAPAGAFDLAPGDGAVLAGAWWRVEDRGDVLGYGWMDAGWGDAEMLLAVHPEHQGRGVGTFILDHLEEEAAAAGLNYLHNVVRAGHPDRERVTAWLLGRGFERSHEDERLRRQVRRRGRLPDGTGS